MAVSVAMMATTHRRLADVQARGSVVPDPPSKRGAREGEGYFPVQRFEDNSWQCWFQHAPQSADVHSALHLSRQ
jgi:hypothetical protein